MKPSKALMFASKREYLGKSLVFLKIAFLLGDVFKYSGFAYSHAFFLVTVVLISVPKH